MNMHNENQWEKLDLNGLELPGDRWNMKFPIQSIFKICYFKIKDNLVYPEMVREIYKTIKSLALENNLISSEGEFKYCPIDADFSFQFAQDYCNNSQCKECPFSPYDFICKLDNGKCKFNKEMKCNKEREKNCPVYNKKGRGMCGLVFSNI